MRCEYAVIALSKVSGRVSWLLSGVSFEHRTINNCREVIERYSSEQPDPWTRPRWHKRPRLTIVRLPDDMAQRGVLVQMLSLLKRTKVKFTRKSYLVMEAMSGYETGVYAIRAVRRTIVGCDINNFAQPLVVGMYHDGEGGDVDFEQPEPRGEDLWCEDE